jgi:hypothetical protein
VKWVARGHARRLASCIARLGRGARHDEVVLGLARIGGDIGPRETPIKRIAVASIISVNAQILLGQSFLSRFSSWSIDNEKHALILN